SVIVAGGEDAGRGRAAHHTPSEPAPPDAAGRVPAARPSPASTGSGTRRSARPAAAAGTATGPTTAAAAAAGKRAGGRTPAATRRPAADRASRRKAAWAPAPAVRS